MNFSAHPHNQLQDIGNKIVKIIVTAFITHDQVDLQL